MKKQKGAPLFVMVLMLHTRQSGHQGHNSTGYMFDPFLSRQRLELSIEHETRCVSNNASPHRSDQPLHNGRRIVQQSSPVCNFGIPPSEYSRRKFLAPSAWFLFQLVHYWQFEGSPELELEWLLLSRPPSFSFRASSPANHFFEMQFFFNFWSRSQCSFVGERTLRC